MNVNISGGIFEFTQGRRWQRYRQVIANFSVKKFSIRSSIEAQKNVNKVVKPKTDANMFLFITKTHDAHYMKAKWS